jgi:hypothetical protein
VARQFSGSEAVCSAVVKLLRQRVNSAVDAKMPGTVMKGDVGKQRRHERVVEKTE